MEDKHQKEIERLKKRIKTLNAKLKKSLETGSRFFKAYSEATHENELLKKMLKESYSADDSVEKSLGRILLGNGD